jgi:aquaporin Z
VGVFVLGPICGAHFNPAITVGFWSVGKITTRDGIAYIVAQLLAGLVAYVCMPMLAQDVLITAAEGDWLTGLAEAVGAFFLAMGVASVVYGKVKESAGFAVGGSLLVGIFFASTLSDGILNPAVALASGAWSLAYAAGPVLGALIGVWAYRWMAGAK